MTAAKSRPASKKATPTKPTAGAKARSAATGAAKSAAKGAAKSAARGAAKGAVRVSSKAAAAGGEQIGRGTRWTEAQVRLLMETVGASDTAKEAFEIVARELDKSAGTVAQKYYNMQKSGGGSGGGTRRSRPTGAKSTAAKAGALPTAAYLRDVTVDELTSLATRVKGEIDRRREELAAAAKELAG